jgi:hypothetical protein
MFEDNLYGILTIVILLALFYLVVRRSDPCKDSLCNMGWANLSLDLQNAFNGYAIQTHEYLRAVRLGEELTSPVMYTNQIVNIMNKFYKFGESNIYNEQFSKLTKYVNASLEGVNSDVALEDLNASCIDIANWHSDQNDKINRKELQSMYSKQCTLIVDLFKDKNSPSTYDLLRQNSRDIALYLSRKTAQKNNF